MYDRRGLTIKNILEFEPATLGFDFRRHFNNTKAA